MINTDLFVSECVRLTEIDPVEDAKVESVWTQDPEYVATFHEFPYRPIVVKQLQRMYEELQKEAREFPHRFDFAVREKTDGKLIGFVRIINVFWSNQSCQVQFSFGSEEWVREYGPEVLELALVYLFDELNLNRVEVRLPEFCQVWAAVLKKAGMQIEVCRRRAIYCNGKYWNQLIYSVLEDEWRLSRLENSEAEA